MKTYYLAGMGPTEFPEAEVGNPDAVATKPVQGLRPIPEQEWAKVHDAMTRVRLYGQEDALFLIHNANVDALFAFLDEAGRGIEATGAFTPRQLDVLHAEAHRHLLNLLSSMRTFLDHSETTLKQRLGNEHSLVKAFKSTCSRHYDRYFAYRFLFKFRNYAQHCGLPVRNLVITSHSEKRTSLQRSRTISYSYGNHDFALIADPRELLAQFAGWGTVKADLEKRRSKVELLRMVRQLSRSIQAIHTTMRRATGNLLRAEVRILNRLVREVQHALPGMYPTILSHAKSARPPNVDFSFHHFPIHAMKELLPRDIWIRALADAAERAAQFSNEPNE
jgi:hypothetical protein